VLDAVEAEERLALFAELAELQDEHLQEDAGAGSSPR
jgi:hypothetical protein